LAHARNIEGTGPRGRIVQVDVEHLKAADFAQQTGAPVTQQTSAPATQQ